MGTYLRRKNKKIGRNYKPWTSTEMKNINLFERNNNSQTKIILSPKRLFQILHLLIFRQNV